MSRTTFTLILVAVVVVVFAAMWLAWRERARRDAAVLGEANAPVGELVAEFARVLYVSTTPVGEPLVRVAAPGLRYRGQAEIVVREDGATVQVRGEQPVHFSADRLHGSGSASGRIGKAVERDGLALIKWQAGDRELESSFRFDNKAEQRRFTAAIDQISHSTATSQEGAK